MDIEIPQEIIECADKIDIFFKTNGIEGWTLNNVASRSIVNETQEIPEHFDAMDVTPEMALSEALKRSKSEQPNAMFCVLLWSEETNYNTAFYNSGMEVIETIALLEFMKHRFLRILNGQDMDG